MKSWMKHICSAIAGVLLPGMVVASNPAYSMESDAEVPVLQEFRQLTSHQKFSRSQLIATIKLYDEHMRVQATGQYLDNVDTHQLTQEATRSSIASTGVGLISLALGDQLGVVENAAEKAHFTLLNLLNKDATKPFQTPRSQSGWYKHFIDAYTGTPSNASKDVFSTIDTAILGVAASMVERYFETRAATDPFAAKAAALANELVQGINWGQSLRFAPRPGMHQIFHGPQEGIEGRFWSLPFDEYVVLPCLGRAVETGQGRRGLASIFWDDHFADIDALPKAQYGDLSLLAVAGKNLTSHFTHQFGFYFCGDLADDPVYRAELDKLRQADQQWFAEAGEGTFPKHWWGLGAGSELKFDLETGEIRYSGYGVAKIGKNPNLTFSPAIMAGFIPIENEGRVGSPLKGYSPIVADLIKLHERNECRYNFAGLDFLWRCTAKDPSLRVQHIEGVDLSTYMLGLAWFDPAIGKAFFDDYGVKARPNFPEATDLRVGLRAPSIANR